MNNGSKTQLNCRVDYQTLRTLKFLSLQYNIPVRTLVERILDEWITTHVKEDSLPGWMKRTVPTPCDPETT